MLWLLTVTTPAIRNGGAPSFFSCPGSSAAWQRVAGAAGRVGEPPSTQPGTWRLPPARLVCHRHDAAATWCQLTGARPEAPSHLPLPPPGTPPAPAAGQPMPAWWVLCQGAEANSRGAPFENRTRAQPGRRQPPPPASRRPGPCTNSACRRPGALVHLSQCSIWRRGAKAASWNCGAGHTARGTLLHTAVRRDPAPGVQRQACWASRRPGPRGRAVQARGCETRPAPGAGPGRAHLSRAGIGVRRLGTVGAECFSTVFPRQTSQASCPAPDMHERRAGQTLARMPPLRLPPATLDRALLHCPAASSCWPQQRHTPVLAAWGHHRSPSGHGRRPVGAGMRMHQQDLTRREREPAAPS